MKTIYYAIFLCLIASSNVYASQVDLVLASKYTNFYNELLNDQAAIQKINLLRPKIYIYTDFGGGKNKNQPLVDLQTSGEISSAAWKETLQEELYINDSAEPLSIGHAAVNLAKTFPYQEKGQKLLENNDDPKKIAIRTIVVHVVDPGVGNDLDEKNPQPRSIILRKDGVLFIGPDNGSLSFVCPPGSIAGAWEIKGKALTPLSGIDTDVGGTFHGRDIFSEAAFRIAAGIISPDEIGTTYENLDLKNRLTYSPEYKRLFNVISPLVFTTIRTDRIIYEASHLDDHELFEKAFLLGIVQSSLYEEGQSVALTNSKKLFVADPKSIKDEDFLIAVVNNKTGNIFIGPDNGLGTSFIKYYPKEDVEIFHITKSVLEWTIKENNNENVCALLEQQKLFVGSPKEINFFGNEVDLKRDSIERPYYLKARIWIDLYGNIKTTVQSSLLDEIKHYKGSVKVIINGVEKQVSSFAETFSQVPSEQLFLYNGSTGAIGPNPHRSNRYVELTANGVFGKFGIDFFEKEGVKPKSGDILELYFEYP